MPIPFSLRCHCGRARGGLLIFLGLSVTLTLRGGDAGDRESSVKDSSAPWTLERCIATALEQNHLRPASRFAVAVAEAQHRQALAGYWPQVNLQLGYQRMDQSPDFLFPASYMGVPAQNISTPASTALISIPAGVLGPTAVQLPVNVPSQTIATSAQVFPVPAQDVKLMDPDSEVASLDLKWLLFDGGMRSGLRQQANAYVEAMKQEARRTDLQIADSVTRMYYGAVLAHQIFTLATDTLARMEATLSLTEAMYKQGSGKVKKTDYLDNKVMVESIRALVAQLGKNEAMARAALANTMGFSWQTSVTPSDTEIPQISWGGELGAMVGSAYEFNPDWKQLEAALDAREGAVRTARSGYAPKVALTGQLHRWWNSYNAGVATDRNKDGWTAGIGLELPIFDGFLTRQKVAEARARLDQTKEQRFLLKEGLGLQIKDIVLSLEALGPAAEATGKAMTAATENRDLTTRAYEQELVDTEKVIRTQLMEALMTSQHYKTLYDLVETRSRLSLVVGTEISRKIEGR